MTLEEMARLHMDENATLICVVAYRFTGYARPGSRVDLCCEVCGQRVALCQTAVQKHQQDGWTLFCTVCLEELEKRTGKPLERAGKLT